MRAMALAMSVLLAARVSQAAPTPAPADELHRWTAQLADPQTRERALTELERLGDPRALDALAAAFRRDPATRILAVMIELARPDPARWPRVGPTLVAALRAIAPDDALALANARLAIPALGESRLPAAPAELRAAMPRARSLQPAIRVAVLALGPAGAITRGAITDTDAVLLADARDPAAGPLLVAALPSPAILDALGRLGIPATAPAVRAIWAAPAMDPATRQAALAAYPEVARADDSALAELAAIADDHDADDALRIAAAIAAAQLARDPRTQAAVAALATRFQDAGARERARADAAPARDAREADARLAAATARAEHAQGTPDADAAAAALVVATKSHRERTLPFRELDAQATADLDAARALRLAGASLALAMRCADDVACYAAALDDPGADADVVAVRRARALLELGKRGPASAALVEHLLERVASQPSSALLRALPKLAPLPCPRCAAALAAVADPDAETAVLAAYFARR